MEKTKNRIIRRAESRNLLILSFKQFLKEAPSYGDPNLVTREPITRYVPATAIKLGTIRGTKTGYHLYRERTKSSTNFYCVHPKTDEVHIRVSGADDPSLPNTWHENVLKATNTPDKEKNIGHHFYNAILNHTNIVSDFVHTPATQKVYKNLTKMKGITARKFSINNKIEDKIHPNDMHNMYPPDEQNVLHFGNHTRIHLSKKKKNENI